MTAWKGKRFAVSFIFDDAYNEHLTLACPMLEDAGMRGTFYVSIPGLISCSKMWRLACSSGHEIGNHTMFHPGPRNNKYTDFILENMTADDIEWELDMSQELIARVTGKEPESFAFPHHQHYLGEGITASSYYPLICSEFTSARLYQSADLNLPDRLNPHTLSAFPMDGLTLDQYMNVIGMAEAEGAWVIFESHRINDGEGKTQTNRGVLEQALAHLKGKDAWVSTVSEIAGEIMSRRASSPGPESGSTLAI